MKRKLQNPLRSLSRGEWGLWLSSLVVVSLSFFLSPVWDALTWIASLIGVTALIFVAKGMVIGQVLTAVFALFYAAVSYDLRYYGEMITYLGMSAPTALAAVIAWLRHPYKDSGEVTVQRLSRRGLAGVASLSLLVTGVFSFILRELGTANLAVSTLSVTTSFLASALTVLRSPLYALGYAANDVVLIVLWVLAAAADISQLPMVLCFVMFFVNDLYGFFNWYRMERRQAENA